MIIQRIAITSRFVSMKGIWRRVNQKFDTKRTENLSYNADSYFNNHSNSNNNVRTTPQATRPNRATGFNTPEVSRKSSRVTNNKSKFAKTSRVLAQQAEMELPLNIKGQTQIITRTARNVQLQEVAKRMGNCKFFLNFLYF